MYQTLEIPFWLIQKNPHVNYDVAVITRGEILNAFENGAEKVTDCRGAEDLFSASDLFACIIATYPNGNRYIWKCEETGRRA